MARFFKPLVSAAALAVASLASFNAFAAYPYTVSLSVTAPKGSTAESAAKDKTKPSSIKFSTCEASASANGVTYPNIDMLTFTLKYDAGKSAEEIGDVYVVLQDLSDPSTPLAANRYYAIGRVPNNGTTPGALALTPSPGVVATGLDTDLATAMTGTPTNGPYVAKSNNLGTGTQTEVIFGNSIPLTGLNNGVWAVTAIIAKPGYTLASLTTPFSFADRTSWAAFDTVPFVLGSPFAINVLAPTAASDSSFKQLSETCL